jgi:hypothetical protein
MSVHLHRGTSLLVAGLALLALAFIGWTVESTILSPTALARATPDLLAQPTARAATVRSVERGIVATLPAIAPETAHDVAEATVDDPGFRAALATGIVAVRDRVVRGTPPDHLGTPRAIDAPPDTPDDPARFTLDGARVDAAVHSAAARLAAEGRPVDALAAARIGPVGIPADAVPDLHQQFRALQVALRVAGYLGLTLVVLGFASTRRRGRALGRISRWAFCTGAATFLAYRALPQLLEWGGGWWGAGGALVRAGDAMTTPALLLVAAGGLGMLVARAWERRERLHALAAVPIGGSARRGRERPWHPVV